MSVFDHREFDGHERVLFVNNKDVGLSAIIALHSTTLGPAAGGCRMYPYESSDAALSDVLRLSKGMTYKNAVAGIPLGGGKSVIIADPSSANKDALLRAFSVHIQSLFGDYWTAIDVGVGPHDADIMAEQCDFIFARASQYEKDFNPSFFTALGGFTGITAAVSHVFGSDELKNKRVAIQGLGATGADLARRLYEQGAELVVADIDKDKVQQVVNAYNAIAVEPEAIHTQDVDVFAPCAMGGILNDSSISEIQAKIICGLANNQLAEERHGDALKDKGIAYVPDYVVNAGGMIGASTVIYNKPDRAESEARIRGLHETIISILSTADKEQKSTAAIADSMAEKILSANRQATD